MSDEQYPPAPDDSTLGGEQTPIQRRPRELPRRGYEGQPRPMTPPPPPPVPPQQPPQQRWTQQPYQEPPQQQPRVHPAPVAPPPPRVQATPPRRPSKSDSGLYLPWWSLVILIVAAGAGAFGLLYVVLNIGQGLIPGDQTPQVIVVTNALQPNINTGGASANPTAFVTPGGIPTVAIVAPTAVPFAAPTETSLPGVTTGCPLNQEVEVIGTGGLPLLIRTGPSQNDPIQGQAAEGERMRIVDGPQTTTGVDGIPIEFCKIEGITVPSRLGWAAREYLGTVAE